MFNRRTNLDYAKTQLTKGKSTELNRLCRYQFFHFENSSPQPEIKVHLKGRFNLRSVLHDFQLFTEKHVLECAFAHPIMLFYHIWQAV